MSQPKTTSGFTLIEIFVVIGISAMLIALSAPFVTSLQSDISMQQTLRQVKVDLVSTLNYSLAGKSFAALSAKQLMNPELIPEAYALYFQVDPSYGAQTPYDYLEFTANSDSEQKSLKSSYQKQNDYPNSSVYLKSITLLNSRKQSHLDLKNAFIFILPPFGKVIFLNENLESLAHLNSEKLEKNMDEYDQIKLTFQYKDDSKNAITLSFDKNKILNIL